MITTYIYLVLTIDVLVLAVLGVCMMGIRPRDKNKPKD